MHSVYFVVADIEYPIIDGRQISLYRYIVCCGEMVSQNDTYAFIMNNETGRESTIYKCNVFTDQESAKDSARIQNLRQLHRLKHDLAIVLRRINYVSEELSDGN